MFQLLITGRARTQLPAFSAAAIDEGLSSSMNDKFTHDLVIFPHLQQFPMDIDKMSCQPVSDAKLNIRLHDIPAPTMLKSSDHDHPPSRSSLKLKLLRFHDPILGLSRSLRAGCSDKHPNGLHPLHYSHNKHHDDHVHMLLQCLHVIMQISQASPSLLLMQENQLISHTGRPYWETLNMLAQDIWFYACGNLQDLVSPDIAGYIPFLQQLAGDLADVTTWILPVGLK